MRDRSQEELARDRRAVLGCVGGLLAAPVLLLATCAVLMNSPSSSAAVDPCTGQTAFMREVRSAQGGGPGFWGQATCNQGTLRMQAAEGWRGLGCREQVEMVGALGRLWTGMDGVRLLVTGAGGAELASYGITGRATVGGC